MVWHVGGEGDLLQAIISKENWVNNCDNLVEPSKKKLILHHFLLYIYGLGCSPFLISYPNLYNWYLLYCINYNQRQSLPRKRLHLISIIIIVPSSPLGKIGMRKKKKKARFHFVLFIYSLFLLTSLVPGRFFSLKIYKMYNCQLYTLFKRYIN